MMAPEWQERSLDAATQRVTTAREREAAATEQRQADEQANAQGEPGGYGRAPASDEGEQTAGTKTRTTTRSTRSKTADSGTAGDSGSAASGPSSDDTSGAGASE